MKNNRNEIEKELIPQWEAFVDALRTELEEYGGLLVMLNEQQECILGKNTEKLLVINESINNQMKMSSKLRNNREVLVMNLLDEWEISKEFESLSDLVPHFPKKQQGLIRALIDQINHVIARTKRKAQQNHLLLSRASEVIEQVVLTLRPQTVKTYTRRGAIALKANSAQGTCMKTSV